MEGSDDIICPKFSISMGGKPLFKDARLALVHGRRYGLIGPNGCGKSTLMHAIGYGSNEDIKKAIPPNTDILLVEQEVAASDEITALQMVVLADTKRTALLDEARVLERLSDAYNMSLDENNAITPDELEKGGVRYVKEKMLEGGPFTVGTKCKYQGREVTVLEEIDKDGDITIQDTFDPDGEIAARLSEVYDELSDIGADSAEQRASAILSGLQFLEEQKSMPTASFSGGWRMRISLARALFRKPRLLLLDEPTNHLDLHAVIWLEGYLQKWKHTLVVVSHDRDFLTTVCTDTLHCWQSKLQHYSGSYDTFAKIFSTRLEEYQAEYTRQQKKIKDLRRQGKVGKDLGKKDGGADTVAYKKQMAMVLGKASQKQRELATFGGAGEDEDEGELLEEIKGLNMKITFPVAGEIPMPILAVDDVSFHYVTEVEDPANPDGPPIKKAGRTLFSGVDFGLNMDSRVALVGANGTGKSTLLKLMLGELEPTEGEVRQSRMCKIGFYNQHSTDQLAKGVRLAKGELLTPVSYLHHTFPEMNVQAIRNALGRFGLEGHHHLQEISTLSGGQKSRVVFVEMGLRRTHLLLLDEPTNHLDLETVDCLVDGLRAFEGGVMVITHNVELINRVCNEIWVIEEGKVNRFPGEFEEYRDMLAEQLSAIADEDPEEKRREKERKEREAAKAEAESLGDGSRPKSKAQRDRERKEAREAKAAKDAAEAEEKAAREKAEQEAREVEMAAAAAARREAEDARLRRESEIAQAGVGARGRPAQELMSQLLEGASSPLEVCGGLLVLLAEREPLSLVGPLVDGILSRLPAGADPASSAAADLVNAWRLSLGWLICRCADLRAAQLELLRGVMGGLGNRGLLVHTAPVLKAMWEADLVEEAVLLEWSGTLRPAMQRCVEPLAAWLHSALVIEE
mmetsp:Transcript_20628/g.62966  ORF Transcript_20628/g.62966 Transcript_20628/m.62966 type:complete len:912 (-) Transcript_20628:585-3320(-)